MCTVHRVHFICTLYRRKKMAALQTAQIHGKAKKGPKRLFNQNQLASQLTSDKTTLTKDEIIKLAKYRNERRKRTKGRDKIPNKLAT